MDLMVKAELEKCSEGQKGKQRRSRAVRTGGEEEKGAVKGKEIEKEIKTEAYNVISVVFDQDTISGSSFWGFFFSSPEKT